MKQSEHMPWGSGSRTVFDPPLIYVCPLAMKNHLELNTNINTLQDFTSKSGVLSPFEKSGNLESRLQNGQQLSDRWDP